MSQAALWTTDPDQFSKQVTHEICLKKIPEIRIVQDRKIGISRKSLDEFSRNPAESSVRENVRWMWKSSCDQGSESVRVFSKIVGPGPLWSDF